MINGIILIPVGVRCAAIVAVFYAPYQPGWKRDFLAAVREASGAFGRLVRGTLALDSTATHHPRRFTLRRAHALLAGIRHSIEELNDPSLQRILSTDDEESLFLNQLLKDFRPVAQMVG